MIEEKTRVLNLKGRYPNSKNRAKNPVNKETIGFYFKKVLDNPSQV